MVIKLITVLVGMLFVLFVCFMVMRVLVGYGAPVSSVVEVPGKIGYVCRGCKWPNTL